ncbi:MAG: hypothetical protein O2890_10400 [Cyanobacteria bacterium]|nr:hypothetical protein [Cyanobacteriota bacterium]MDA0866810.1 hypothetical protein [Cyanobacteriota bacterium]
MKLSKIIQDPSVKASIVADCTELMETQVNAKSGITGLALKAAYRVAKSVGASYIPGAVGRLLPALFEVLEPIWEEGVAAGDPVDYLAQNRSRTADTLLSLTDKRAQNSPPLVKSTYNKMRQSVQGDVEAAIPELAKIIGQHLYAMQQA